MAALDRAWVQISHGSQSRQKPCGVRPEGSNSHPARLEIMTASAWAPGGDGFGAYTGPEYYEQDSKREAESHGAPGVRRPMCAGPRVARRDNGEGGGQAPGDGRPPPDWRSSRGGGRIPEGGARWRAG